MKSLEARKYGKLFFFEKKRMEQTKDLFQTVPVATVRTTVRIY